MGSSMFPSIRGSAVNQSIQIGGMVLGIGGISCLACFGLFTTLGGVMALVTTSSLVIDWGEDDDFTDPSLIAGSVLVAIGGLMLITSGILLCLLKRRYREMGGTLTTTPLTSDPNLHYQYTTNPANTYGSSVAIAASFPAHRSGSVSTAGLPPQPQHSYTAPPPQQVHMPSAGYPTGMETGFGSTASYLPQATGPAPTQQYSYLQTQNSNPSLYPSPGVWGSANAPGQPQSAVPPPPQGFLPTYNPVAENPHEPSKVNPDDLSTTAGSTSASAPPDYHSHNFSNP